MLYPDRSRRAAGSWILFARGQRTAADPCDSVFGCRVPVLAEWELRGCRWPWVQYAVSCRCRWGCKLLLRPGMDCSACPCQNIDSLLQKRSPWLSAQIEESSEGQHAWLNRDKSDSSENTYLDVSTQAHRWYTVKVLQLLSLQMSVHMYSSNKGILQYSYMKIIKTSTFIKYYPGCACILQISLYLHLRLKTMTFYDLFWLFDKS